LHEFAFAGQREAFDFREFFAEMVVVEAIAASPTSRRRFFKRLIWRTLRERSSAALAYAKSPLRHVLIALTRCSSF